MLYDERKININAPGYGNGWVQGEEKMIEGTNDVVDGLNIATIKCSSVVRLFRDGCLILEGIRVRVGNTGKDYCSLLIESVSCDETNFVVSSNYSFTPKNNTLIIRGAKIEDGILIIDKQPFVTVKDDMVVICKGINS